MNILIAVAHQLELDPFIARFSVEHSKNNGHGKEYQLQHEGHHIRLIRTGIGMDSAKASLEHAVSSQEKSPELILNFGTCGGIHPDRQIDDLVLGTQVICDKPECPPIDLVSEEQDNFRDYLTSQKTPFFEGSVFSTERAIANERDRYAIYSGTKAQVVDMEGYGLAEIAMKHELPLVMMKSVSDNADEFVMKDFLVNVQDAMTALSDHLFGFLNFLSATPKGVRD